MSEKLTKAQRALLERMGDTPNALRNGDEGSPTWWIEGGAGVHGGTARACILKGLIQYSGKWGGQPGVLGYSVTNLGRAALGQGGGNG
jgi:hypothetical protein